MATEARFSQRLPLSNLGALGIVGLVAAAHSIVGSDAMWLVAMGDRIRTAGGIPAGIPFAEAPSANWVNTTALGQLAFSGLHVGGSLSIVVAQVVALLATLTVVSLEATARRARPMVTAMVVVTVVIGAATSLLIARAQLLSLVPYALLLVLIRRQQLHPSAAIWWSVPLVALWGNVHGAVLAGVAVLGCYLLFSRLRHQPWTAIGVGLAALTATCINPGLLGAPRYYLGVFGGEATDAESGMWSQPSLDNPFDVLLLLAAITLVAMAVRRRRPLWEYAAALGLVGATLSASRHGVWLLLFLAVPAATGVSTPKPATELSPRIGARTASATVAILCVFGTGAVFATRAPSFGRADAQAAEITAATHGEVVLVAEPLAESLAAAGAIVWASNPLDAFAPADQAAYLSFVSGNAEGARAALEGSTVVVALSNSDQERVARAGGYRPSASVGPYVLLRRE